KPDGVMDMLNRAFGRAGVLLPADAGKRTVVLGCALAIAALLLQVDAAAGRRGRKADHRDVIAPYDTGGAFWGGDLLSPDRRYIASARIGEAAVENLTILDAQSRKPQVRAEDVDGFVWVPL